MKVYNRGGRSVAGYQNPMRRGLTSWFGFWTDKQRPRRQLALLVLLSWLLGPLTVSAAEFLLDLNTGGSELQGALVAAHKTPPSEWQVLLPPSSGKTSELTLQAYQPFATGARVFLDENMLSPNDYDQTTAYARGVIQGVPHSFAFLALRSNGDVDLRYGMGDTETRIRIQNGQRTSEQRPHQKLGPSGTNPLLDDVVKPPHNALTMPSAGQGQRSSANTPVNTVNRTEILSGGIGWSSVYSLEIPAGQTLTGVISKGPGVAGVVIIKDLDPTTNWSTSGCSDGSTLDSSCLIENPSAGTYYVAAYKFDSSDTTLVFNYADTLAATEQLSATIAIDTDGGFYSLSQFASTDDILDYFAALFAYSSSIYETEVNTALQIGDVFLFSPAGDPYTSTTDTSVRLPEVQAYWETNRAAVTRTLAAHFSDEQFGGRAYLDGLCSNSYGYSVTGAYGVAPGSGAPINQDAHFFAHEIGHNFSSPHTHCYAGVASNPDPVDACYNGESSCYSGSESLPGVASLSGGSSGAGNGTIMSYCHLLSGSSGNISPTFGASHPYGVAASRVSNALADRVFEVAAVDQACITTNTIAFTVTPSALTGGSISPDTEQSVASGETTDFVLTADTGYVIDEVTGTCPGSLAGDAFSAGAIVEDCTVIANFTAITLPSGVTIDQTDVGDGEIYLTVSLASDGGGAISFYEAVCSDGTSDFTGQSTTTTITVSGLENDDSYTCTVTATNSAGTSSASAASDTLTPEALPGLPIWLLEAVSQSASRDVGTTLILRDIKRLQSAAVTSVARLFASLSSPPAETAEPFMLHSRT